MKIEKQLKESARLVYDMVIRYDDGHDKMLPFEVKKIHQYKGYTYKFSKAGSALFFVNPNSHTKEEVYGLVREGVSKYFPNANWIGDEEINAIVDYVCSGLSFELKPASKWQGKEKPWNWDKYPKW